MEQFLRRHYYNDLVTILAETVSSPHHSISVDFLLLLDEEPSLACALIEKPVKGLDALQRDLSALQKSIAEELGNQGISNASKAINVHARIVHLPSNHPDIALTAVPKSKHNGRLVMFSGVVTKASSMKMYETERAFECASCHGFTRTQFDFCLGEYHKPGRCSNLTRNGDRCNSSSFTKVQGTSSTSDEVDFRDYQEIRVQETVDKLEMGNIPRSVTVILENDLTDKTKPGDRITIFGIVRQKWRQVPKGERCEMETFIIANNIIIHNEQKHRNLIEEHVKNEFTRFWSSYESCPLQGRGVILKAFAPIIHGMDWIKLAVLVVLVGGVQKTEESMKIRGESHILLVGDPGTGKSQFLKFAANLVPRSVVTTGIGSTTAGLTCAAVKDGAEWSLEAGALVLADGGLCCIDEFGSIRANDKNAIHEAMEQQTLSVAKAGLICKLNTRCSIIAATNPKGNYDCTQSLEVNVNLASPLLSRFDLIFTLLDSKNSAWDRTVSRHILNNELSAGYKTDDSDSLWDLDKLKSYIAYCKTFEPEITEECQQILSRYYQHQRRTDHLKTARTTIRMLESLIRIAQAHARLMCRDIMLKMDAVIAVFLIESSLMGTGLLGNKSALHASFALDPDTEYLEYERKILEGLGLSYMLGESVDVLADDETLASWAPTQR